MQNSSHWAIAELLDVEDLQRLLVSAVVLHQLPGVFSGPIAAARLGEKRDS